MNRRAVLNEISHNQSFNSTLVNVFRAVFEVLVMKHFVRVTIVSALMIIGAIDAMAIEEAKYELIKKVDTFEIRDYSSHILVTNDTTYNIRLRDQPHHLSENYS